jgi:hypothetical protein
VKFARFVNVRVDDDLNHAIQRKLAYEKSRLRQKYPGPEINLSTLLRPILWRWAESVPRETKDVDESVARRETK